MGTHTITNNKRASLSARATTDATKVPHSAADAAYVARRIKQVDTFDFITRVDTEKPAQRRLDWWYRLAAPAEPGPGASLARRENARRGRLGSLILLFVTLWNFTAIPTAIASKNPIFLPILLLSLLMNLLTLWLNKVGRVVEAGIMAATIVTLFYSITILNAPNGLTVSSLINYDMLIESLLIVVSLLPARYVFVMVAINVACILLDVTLQPKAPDLAQLFAHYGYISIAHPILLQGIVAVVSYLWVNSAIHAIARADRAEEVAALQRNIAEQKRQLDTGIQEILNTHILVANGNFGARAPLTQENILWQIAFSLNNLLARLQRYSQMEQELQRMKREAARLAEILHTRSRQAEQSEQDIARTQIELGRLVKAVHEAKSKQSSIWFTTGGTMLDPLIQALQGHYIGTYIPSLKVNLANEDEKPPGTPAR